MRITLLAFPVFAAAVASCASPGLAPGDPPQGSPTSNQELFIAAHGEFGRSARGNAPMIKVAALHVPDGEVHNEPGEFDLTHFALDAIVPIPISRDTFLIAGAHAGARDYEFTPAVVGAADEVLYNAGLRFGAGHFLEEDLLVQAFWQPSLYSDLDGSLESEDLKLWYGTVLGVKRTSPDWFWKVGFTLTDAVDTGVLPVLGFSWIIDPKWRMDVLFPRNAELVYGPNPDWSFNVGLDLESDEFHVRSTAATGKAERDIHVQDLRAFVGALRRLGKNASVFAKVGTNVVGHYDWSYGAGPDYDGTLERGVYAQLGFGWNF